MLPSLAPRLRPTTMPTHTWDMPAAEGISPGNGTATLTFKGQGGTALGSDVVQYTFISADCGNQPRTIAPPDNQRARFQNWFPRLVDCEWSIREPADGNYNCIAWSVGRTNVWIYQPGVYPPQFGKGVDGLERR
jgi:hypothetical protein